VRVSELRSFTFSDTQAVGNHCKGDLCLDNAFALIEGHPIRAGSGSLIFLKLRRSVILSAIPCQQIQFAVLRATRPNGQEAAGYSNMMRPISKEAAQAAIGDAAWDKAQAAATPGAFESYLVAHKSGLRGLLGDIVLAGTPAPEVHWLAKVKEVVEGLLFVRTVHELVP